MSQELQSIENVQVGLVSSKGFELAQRAARMLSSSSLVPKEYQGEQGLANCIIALNMANRIGADPLMVMQNLVPVYGKPSWSSQFLIATFNSCGRFSSMRFEFFGEKGNDDWGCRAFATEKSSGERIVGSDITIGIAKSEGWYQKNGSKWKTMPQQMLQYRAASWLVRAYAPELSMGLHTQDEVIDVTEFRDITDSVQSPNSVIESKTESTLALDAILDDNNDVEIVDMDTGEILVELQDVPVVVEYAEVIEPELVVDYDLMITNALKSASSVSDLRNRLKDIPADKKAPYLAQFKARSIELGGK